MKVVHFVNRADFHNAGDFACGIPGILGLQNCVMLQHDIDAIQWNYIQRGDVVVVGASGMLDVTEGFNQQIIRLLDTCDTVVGWGIGFNRTPGQEPMTPILPHLERFKLLGIRDYNNPHAIRYLPCPSVFHVKNVKVGQILRPLGVVHHRDHRITAFEGIGIDNSRSLAEVLEFISTSETVVSTSYHALYWAHLMGKKAVLPSKWSQKFDCLRHPVGSHLTDAVAAPPDFMEECVALNSTFMREFTDLVMQSEDRAGGNVLLKASIEGRLANLAWRVATLEMGVGRYRP